MRSTKIKQYLVYAVAFMFSFFLFAFPYITIPFDFIWVSVWDYFFCGKDWRMWNKPLRWLHRIGVSAAIFLIAVACFFVWFLSRPGPPIELP